MRCPRKSCLGKRESLQVGRRLPFPPPPDEGRGNRTESQRLGGVVTGGGTALGRGRPKAEAWSKISGARALIPLTAYDEAERCVANGVYKALTM